MNQYREVILYTSKGLTIIKSHYIKCFLNETDLGNSNQDLSPSSSVVKNNKDHHPLTNGFESLST